MQKIKVFSLLSTFDDGDWKAAHKYVISQTKKGTDLEVLYSFCRKHKLRLNHAQFNVNYVHSKILLNNSRKSVLNAFSALKKNIDEYLITTVLSKEEGLRKYLLMREYNHRGKYEMAESTFQSVIDKEPKISLEDSLMRWLMHHYMMFSDNPVKYEKGQEILNNSIKSMKKAFTEYGGLYELEIANRASLYEENYEPQLAQLTQIGNDLTSTNTFSLIKALISLRKNSSDEAYNYVKNKVHNSLNELSKDLRFLCIFFMIKHSVFRIRSGQKEWYHEIFKNYEIGLSKQILTQKGKISDLSFYNIFSILSQSGDYQKFESLVNQYAPIIESGLIEESKSLAWVQFYISEENYEKVIELCAPLKFIHPNTEILLRKYMCIAHCEISNREFVSNHLNNTKRYLKRHRSDLSKATYQGNLNFINFLDLKFVKKKSKLELSTFLKDRNVYNRSWIEQRWAHW